jgi:hypothetical protein
MHDHWCSVRAVATAVALLAASCGDDIRGTAPADASARGMGVDAWTACYVVGHVVTDLGDPVPNAIVRMGEREVRANHVGRFRGSASASWDGELVARADGFDSANATVDARPGPREAVLRLSASSRPHEPASRAVVVLDDLSCGVADCTVRMWSATAEATSAAYETKSRADGFAWVDPTRVPPAPWRVQVAAPDGRTTSLERVCPGNDSFPGNTPPVVLPRAPRTETGTELVLPEYVPVGARVRIWLYGGRGQLLREATTRSNRVSVPLAESAVSIVQLATPDAAWVFAEPPIENGCLDLRAVIAPPELVVVSDQDGDAPFRLRLARFRGAVPYGVTLRDVVDSDDALDAILDPGAPRRAGACTVFASPEMIDFVPVRQDLDRLPVVRLADTPESGGAVVVRLSSLTGRATVRVRAEGTAAGPESADVTLARRGGAFSKTIRVARGQTVSWDGLCSGTFMMWAERVPDSGRPPEVRARYEVRRLVVEPDSSEEITLALDHLAGGPVGTVLKK